MDIVLCERSALEYWRNCVNRPKRYVLARDWAAEAALNKGAITLKELQQHGVFGASGEADILVPSAAARYQGPRVTNRLYSEAIGSCRLYQLSRGLFVVSPELCFVQMCRNLSIPRSAYLGNELCGAYASVPSMIPRTPLTRPHILRHQCGNLGSVKGVARARKAIPYISSGAASPMEAKLALLLCLNTSMGGYGLPAPVFNFEIQNRAIAQVISGRGRLRCDLFWPGVVVEYDSDAYHCDPDSLASDASKRAALVAQGITPLTLTRGQLADIRQMDAFVGTLCSAMGRRFRIRIRDFRARQIALRQDLHL